METPDHRFQFYLFDKTGKLPDDPFYDDIDPLMRLWLYEGWRHKQELDLKRDRALGILIGSFTDPEAAQKMIKREQPDFVSDEQGYQDAIKQVHQDALKSQKKKGRRKRNRRVVKPKDDKR